MNAYRKVTSFWELLYDRFLDLPRNIKQAVLLALDLVMVPAALWLAMVMRLGTSAELSVGILELLVVGVTMLVTAIAFLRLGLYRAVIRFMGHQAIIAILKAVTISALTLALLAFVSRVFMPRSVPFIYWTLLFFMAGGTRLLLRGYHHHRVSSGGIPVAIYGAGAAGRELERALSHGGEYRPVLFVDDDPNLQGTVIGGIPVHAPDMLTSTIEQYGIKQLLLAIAAVAQSRRREIINQLVDLPVYVRTIPATSELMSGRARIGELRDISLEELLGREPVPPHPELLAKAIGGRCVMVTGAGGSIGSELCRQILLAGPSGLVLYEQSEYSLYSIERELRAANLSLGDSVEIVPFLGNVQDEAHLTLVMRRLKVATVFHCAAYKHVPLVEHNVFEGVKNNVFGAENAARAAINAGVVRFVLISSDKAVRPTNIMGASKRLAELVVKVLADQNRSTHFAIVRFGNVLGSSGSVVPLFREQIERGGPVTVTHSEVERYFMTIPEAAQLVLQAGAMGDTGELFVLEMGQPIRIIDLARRMVRLMGQTVKDENNPHGAIEIRVTGLRPGEKLAEELLLDSEISETGHPMILCAEETQRPAEDLQQRLSELRAACAAFDFDAVRALFAAAVQGFSPRHPCIDELVLRAPQPEPATVARLFPHRD